MTPLQFERQYEAEWTELEAALASLRTPRRRRQGDPVRGDRVAALYRRACEQLAIARARAYPAFIVDRLEHLTAAAHQLIYQQRELGAARLKTMVLFEFPRRVRQQAAYVLVAALAFFGPLIATGLLVYARPELILSVVSAETAASFDEMYSAAADAIGRRRTASNDWMMFGYYIRNNIGIAFQCFATGLFAGLGSLFFLIMNGAFGGAIAGYLTARGLGETFYSFVVAHAAFELTAIVLSGAAGLRIGHALLSPGLHRRSAALVLAARETAVVVYGVAAMLVVAAAVEAFWSSATWLPPAVKYSVAALCWVAVLAYFALQGRRAG